MLISSSPAKRHLEYPSHTFDTTVHTAFFQAPRQVLRTMSHISLRTYHATEETTPAEREKQAQD
jgi:hypothetical protein